MVMILFGDFLERLTGGTYDRKDGAPLYYRTTAYPEPKKIVELNTEQERDAMMAIRLRDGRPMYWDRRAFSGFKVLSVSKYGGMVEKGTLISLEKI
jgi:hypothetical protein